jgi:glycosyltransferase involved in cell wall biosynthesis
MSITVIIPTLNSSHYIDKCLNSIITQSNKSIDIIVVDGGSTDNTKEICKSYPVNLTYIESKGIRQGEARNIGLRHASTEFVTFLDSDDYYLNRTFIEEVLSLDLKDRVDIISSSINFVNSSGKVVKKIQIKNNFYLNGDKIFIDGMLELNFYSIPWNKIYRREFLLSNGIFFPDTREQEDIYFSRLCAYKAESVFFSKLQSVNALVRIDSRSRKMKPQNILSIFDVYSLLKDSIVKYDEDLIALGLAKSLAYLMLLGSIRFADFSEFLKLYKTLNKREFLLLKNNKYWHVLPLKNKLIIFICNFRVTFFIVRSFGRFFKIGY